MSMVVSKLIEWKQFPKYALERRLDILLTPFIGAFVVSKLGGKAQIIAPEFPLLARLDPERRQRKSKEPSRLTVNVDYLLYLDDGTTPSWMFLELKTEGSSFKPAQLRHYRRAQALGMAMLLDDLVEVGTHSKHTAKYERLNNTVRDSGALSAPIRLAFLSPPPRKGFPDGGDNPRYPKTEYWTFADFKRLEPTEHRELWSELQPLLDRL